MTISLTVILLETTNDVQFIMVRSPLMHDRTFMVTQRLSVVTHHDVIMAIIAVCL